MKAYLLALAEAWFLNLWNNILYGEYLALCISKHSASAAHKRALVIVESPAKASTNI